MDSELHYLHCRANFHRRMARQAACGEAKRAHEAFARAYRERIEAARRADRSNAPGAEPVRADACRPLLAIAAAE